MRAALVLVLVLSASIAQAQQPGEIAPPPISDRPTSGEASLLSGRTLGTGEVMIAAAAGWPWIWVQIELAPTSEFNVGIRGALIYGSPIMALQAGAGGEISLPTRIHLHGDENVDIAVFVNPAFVIAEGAALGEAGTVFSANFGWSTRLEAGGLFAIRPMERLTVNIGVGGHFGFVHIDGAGDPSLVGAVWARFGVEGLISRDTMLFGEIDGGIGFAPANATLQLFGSTVPPLIRVSLGVGYLL